MARIGACVFFFAVMGMLIVTTNAAYSCADAERSTGQPFKLKAGASCNETGGGEGPCNNGQNECCEIDTARCHSPVGATAGVTCTTPATQYVDWTVTGSTAAVCCKDKALCSTFTCPAGEKQRTGTIYCDASACDRNDESTCCENDATKCKAFDCATKPKLAGSDGKTGATAALCCGEATCGDYVYEGTQSDGSTITYNNQELCSAMLGKDYDSTQAATVVTFPLQSGNFASCCKAAATPTCKTWHETAGNDCADGTYKADYTVIGATQALCCPAQPTCAAFVDPNAAGALVSGAHGVAHAAWASVLLLCMLTNFVLQM